MSHPGVALMLANLIKSVENISLKVLPTIMSRTIVGIHTSLRRGLQKEERAPLFWCDLVLSRNTTYR
jgi:hypothetical protein